MKSASKGDAQGPALQQLGCEMLLAQRVHVGIWYIVYIYIWNIVDGIYYLVYKIWYIIHGIYLGRKGVTIS